MCAFTTCAHKHVLYVLMGLYADCMRGSFVSERGNEVLCACFISLRLSCGVSLCLSMSVTCAVHLCLTVWIMLHKGICEKIID